MATTIQAISFPESSWVYAYGLTCDQHLFVWYYKTKRKAKIPSVCVKYVGTDGPTLYNAMRGSGSKGKYVWRFIPYRRPYSVITPPNPPWSNQCGIAFRAFSKGGWTYPSATTDITLPTGTLATDVVLLLCGGDGPLGGVTFTKPASGWNDLFTGDHLDDGDFGDSSTLFGFWALGNVVAPNLTFTVSDPLTTGSVWLALSFSGVNNTTPVDVVGPMLKDLDPIPKTYTVPSITTVTDNALWLLAAYINSVADPFSAPGFTTIDNFNSSPPLFNTTDILYANTPTSPAGPTGPIDVLQDGDSTGANQATLIVPLALKPT